MPHYRVTATVTATVTEKWSVVSQVELSDEEVVEAITEGGRLGVEVECVGESIDNERDREFGAVELL